MVIASGLSISSQHKSSTQEELASSSNRNWYYLRASLAVLLRYGTRKVPPSARITSRSYHMSRPISSKRWHIGSPGNISRMKKLWTLYDVKSELNVLFTWATLWNRFGLMKHAQIKSRLSPSQARKGTDDKWCVTLIKMETVAHELQEPSLISYEGLNEMLLGAVSWQRTFYLLEEAFRLTSETLNSKSFETSVECAEV